VYQENEKGGCRAAQIDFYGVFLFEADQFLSGNVPGDVMADMAAELPEQRKHRIEFGSILVVCL
jgi:hypothetical protein